MKVLIAHADAAARRRVRELLEPRGYEVTEARTGEEVVREYSGSTPDVALLQGSLTRESGPSLLSRLKSHPEAFFTAIVMVEQELEHESALAQLRGGVHDFLMEPLRAGEVIARVQAAARTKSLQEELLDQGRRLESLIFEDPLTDLYNRRFMLIQLAALISGARRHKRPISVVMIDIDHFKAFNDRYGHDLGDRALITTAHAMRDRLRAEDYLGRLGGEEFLVLLPDVGEEGAAHVAESLRRTVEEAELEADGERLSMTVSAGWAVWHGEAPHELLRRADDAMYAAKQGGRNAARRG